MRRRVQRGIKGAPRRRMHTMDGNATTLLDAFTRFDRLVKQLAGRPLNDRAKQMLDQALGMHNAAAAKLGQDPSLAVPDFGPVS